MREWRAHMSKQTEKQSRTLTFSYILVYIYITHLPVAFFLCPQSLQWCAKRTPIIKFRRQDWLGHRRVRWLFALYARRYSPSKRKCVCMFVYMNMHGCMERCFRVYEYPFLWFHLGSAGIQSDANARRRGATLAIRGTLSCHPRQ